MPKKSIGEQGAEYASSIAKELRLRKIEKQVAVLIKAHINIGVPPGLGELTFIEQLKDIEEKE
ncbi:hypothetical protein LCGC14_1518830 [marine sediment metagenome]|uniref:Uncharacterized protein n=1 Tax=marine sediment metagenome TaxID=412755 RepID=A0A0F9LEU8_9ZZZZ